MTVRTASCACGQLRVTCEGEPDRISICHCLECQKRSGNVFATQARFPSERVAIAGQANQWSRRGGSGQPTTFNFCPICGVTLYWEPNDTAGFVTVPVGCFADPGFPPPHVSVYEERRHPLALAAGKLPLEHIF